MRQIEEDAAHRGVRLQQRDELRAVAAADVDDRVDAGEVVGFEDGVRLAAVDADHRGVEDLGLVEMFAEVVEDGLAEDFVERFFAGLDAVDDFASRPGIVRRPT